jgi:outer membrane protein TolC
MPLFAGGRRTAQYRLASAQYARAREQQQAASQLIGLEVQKAYLEYREAAERVRLNEAAVKDAQRALQSYHNQFAGRQIAQKDLPKHFENEQTTILLLTLNRVQYNTQVYRYNLSLATIQLVTASDE